MPKSSATFWATSNVLVLAVVLVTAMLPRPASGFLHLPAAAIDRLARTCAEQTACPSGQRSFTRCEQPRRQRCRRRRHTCRSGAAVAAAAGCGAAAVFAEELGMLDEEQAAMMTEECILVDRNDVPTGSASKVETHLASGGLLLHRAFSVFLFDRQGRLLMQRRADSKHTFPGFWTNTCCSHPMWNAHEMGTDTGEEGILSEGGPAVLGATRAAVRKLGQELGIPAHQLPLDDFCFLTKVHYIASSGPTWGEHEIDYVFFVQAEVDLDPNPNEVSDAEFLDQEGLRSLLASASRGEVEFTPWSRYIIDNFVFGWWDHVGDKDKLESFRDDVIHRVGTCAEE